MTRTISRDLVLVWTGLVALLALGCSHDLRARHGADDAEQVRALRAHHHASPAGALRMRDVDRPSAKLGSLELVHTGEVEPLRPSRRAPASASR
jgi:hypothetical protein